MQKIKQLLEKFSSGVILFYRYTVSLFFFAIILFLYCITAVSTTILIKEKEGGHFFISDHPIITLIVIAAIIAVFVIMKGSRSLNDFIERIKKDDAYFKKVRFIMLGAMGIISLFWVFSTQFIPTADQIKIQNVVNDLRAENYTLFEPGEYFEIYTNQYGLVLISYFFSAFFGSSNYLVFSLFNVAAIMLFYYSLSELCGSFSFGRSTQLAVIGIGFLFYPLIIYSCYIYGTLGGLALGVAAMDMELKYFINGKRRNAIACIVFIMLAIIIKTNYSIFLIALVICAFIEVIRNKQLKQLILPGLLIVSLLVSVSLPVSLMSHITGSDLQGGASLWGWLAMGLQEGDRGPGAYNGYNLRLYRDVCNNDTQLHEFMAKENIVERLKVFSEDKAYAISFFTKKQAYQWGDPTYQYAWNIRDKRSQIELSNWIENFSSPGGTRISVIFLDRLTSFVYFGALLYCVLCRNKTNIYTLVLPMTFIGGYVFHTFWEAGPRYTLPFFVLLFPICIAGYSKLILLLPHLKKKKITKIKFGSEERKRINSTLLSLAPYICIAAAVICSVGVFLGVDSSLTADNEAYQRWLQTSDKQLIREGKYLLYAADDKGITLGEHKESSDESVEIKLSKKPTEVRVVYYDGDYWLKFPEERLYLTAESSSQKISAVRSGHNIEEHKWLVVNAGKNAVCFVYNRTYALTYDSEKDTVYLSKFNANKNQIWYLIKDW